MRRGIAACCVVTLVSPVYSALVKAEQPQCVESVIADETVPTTVPDETVPDETVPDTTVPDTTTTVPDTTTTVPDTTTTVPDTTTTVPDTTTTVPDTTTTVPDTTTTVPDETDTTTTVPDETDTTTTTTIPTHLDPGCPPVVELVDFPGWGTNDNYFIAMVSPLETPSLQPPAISPTHPLDPRVDPVYTVSAQIAVTPPITLEALKDVTMCWANNDALPEPDDPAPPVASADCSTLDPRNNFMMVWSEAVAAAANDGAGSGTHGFAVAYADPANPSQYQNVGSQVETSVDGASYDKSLSVMTIRFEFRVSSAMAQGVNWSVSITATYDSSDTPSTTTAVDSLAVDHWSQILVRDNPVDFGSVAPGGTGSNPEVDLGVYGANGVSKMTLQGSNYVCISAGCSASLSLVATPPSGGEVLLSCAPKDGSPINLTTTGITPFLQLEPTGEDRVALPKFSCSLSYGGDALRAGTYRGPINANIGPLSTPPTTGG